MNLSLQSVTVGWVLALLVFVITVVLVAIGQVPLVVGALIAGAALARLF